jgi:hypothetical protein
MNKKLVSTFALAIAFAGVGCDGQSIDDAASGRPALSAEDQAIADNMARNTLAEIDLPEGKMVFVEVAPGDVAVMRQIRLGADVTRVEGADEMDLEQLFQAYAPGRETPPALRAAMQRAHTAQAAAVSDATVVPATESVFAGDKPAGDRVLAADGTERVSSALASSIDQAWFTKNLCGFSAINQSWCYTTAWVNAWGKRTSHRHNAAVCGDTGAAQVKSWVSGNARVVVDVPYGSCWTIGFYHGPHDFFGGSLKRTIETKVIWAESTIRFSGYFADGDQFIASPY